MPPRPPHPGQAGSAGPGEAVPPLVAVLGPTASGKSALAMALAEQCDGEILCADSATVYRELDIGTAKPSKEDQARVRHHLLDLLDPTETFTFALFQQAARAAIVDIHQRGKLPILTGGTGLYIRGLLEGYTLPDAPPDEAFRAAAADRTLPDLITELQALDPAALAIVDLQNPRRVIRALEVARQTGSFSRHYQRDPLPYPTLKLGLNPPDLRERIVLRAQQMVQDGLLEEVLSLAKKGWGPHIQRLRIIGYREILAVVEHQGDLQEAVAELVTHTYQFSRRQLTWLRSEPGVEWVTSAAEAIARVERFRAEI